MTSEGTLDFNDAYIPFGHLGDKVGGAVQDAITIIEGNRDKFDRARAALRAARPLLYALAEESQSGPKDTAALLDILEALNVASQIVKEAQPREAGRPSGPSVFWRQAHAVVALDWLQQLRTGALDRKSAELAVAACIPVDLLQAKPGEYGQQILPPREQLKAWLDAFGRQRNTKQRRALANVRGSLWDDFYRSWREPIRDLPDGTIEYSENWHERDHLDMTREVVVEWLRRGLAASSNDADAM